MSVFTELGIPSGIISYCVLQQTSSATDIKEFRKLFDESFQKTLAEAVIIRDGFQSALLETRIKSAQVALGSLNQYLSTPIKSDNEDVQRIIKDALEKYSDQILPAPNAGVEAAWCSQIVSDSLIVSTQTKLSVVVRKMLSAGKRMLKELGFTRGKTPPNIFETVYLLKTGMNLDVLEWLIRKSTSGADIPQGVENTWTGMHNVVSTTGTAEQTANLWEAAFYPHATGMISTEFILEMEKILERLSKEFNLQQLSLWQKKFSFAEGNNFTVRIRMIPDQKLLFEIVKWLASSENELLKKSLTGGAALIVKEIIS